MNRFLSVATKNVFADGLEYHTKASTGRVIPVEAFAFYFLTFSGKS
jgi:hypothetical protein